MTKRLKGYFFSQIEEGSLGPRKKVENQIKTFAQNGIELQLEESPFKLTGRIRGNFLLRQLVCRFPFTYVYSKHEYKDKYKDADVYYIRFLAGDSYFTKFLKQLRKNNPRAILILELADYPTTWYMTTSVFYSIVYSPIILKDIIAGKKYKRYVDRIVMPQKREEAFKVPVISFKNGIDVESIKKREPQEKDIISIIGVAGMCNFHGYDRIIAGLADYYDQGGKREVEIHLVGGKSEPGNELSNYKRLAQQHSLEDKIIFYGQKTGKELDEIYDKCNLAVGSLGMYRIGYESAGSLKSREYLAKGMPVITGCKIDIFEEDKFPYYIEFPNDSSPINIKKIIEFYDNIHQEKNEEQLNDEIRQFAVEKCDMDVALRPVIDYILSHSGEK